MSTKKRKTPNLKIGDRSPCSRGANLQPVGSCSSELSCAKRLTPETCSCHRLRRTYAEDRVGDAKRRLLTVLRTGAGGRVHQTAVWGFPPAFTNVSYHEVCRPGAR